MRTLQLLSVADVRRRREPTDIGGLSCGCSAPHESRTFRKLRRPFALHNQLRLELTLDMSCAMLGSTSLYWTAVVHSNFCCISWSMLMIRPPGKLHLLSWPAAAAGLQRTSCTSLPACCGSFHCVSLSSLVWKQHAKQHCIRIEHGVHGVDARRLVPCGLCDKSVHVQLI
jgi:hypothetical protein